jgi:N-acetylmuramidase/Papain family cysteine protease
VNRSITPDAWKSLSQSLMVEEAALRAVAAVESSGSGFLAPPSELPKVLFEGHAFHRLTQGQFDEVEPTLSFPKWTREHYSGTAAGEWKRLERAKGLDRSAALQSASWGMFQIMGFNYSLCGFSNVDAFVVTQCSGADGQLESFARFIARDVFLFALRKHDWARFASLYNGPAFAKNQYDRKLAEAYDAFSVTVPAGAAGAVGTRRRAARKSVAFIRHLKPKSRPAQGRPDFAPIRAPRRQPIRRTVKPDPVDLRDFLYRPAVSIAPPASLMPGKLRPINDQGNTQACTGFSLATSIEYLLERGKRHVEPLSGYMLYSMARRYDEWTSNDDRDEGSSLRGALKGWARHGASAFRLWRKMKMPSATFKRESDWWLDAVTRPLGAYYRLTADVVSDIHIALVEAGVVYASALTHEGWDELLGEIAQPAPVAPGDLPVIQPRAGLENGGHAFAIVGYTEKGFIVQNSWGPKWGRGGFAVLTYGDWRKNAMDCWVVQLGVVTTDHEQVASAATLRVDAAAGRVLISSNPNLAAHEISPFVIDMENEGRLSDRGQFRTSLDDLKLLLDHHAPAAAKRWSIPANGTLEVAIYAHGGLNSEEYAASAARAWIPLLYSNRIFPVFLMWETSGLDSLFNIVEDAVRGDEERIGADWWNRFKDSVSDWKNERIEGIARVPGGDLWRQMKDNAEDISSTRVSGVVQLFQQFQLRRRKLPKIRIHLIGHSAGAIVHSYLAARALELGFEIGSINFLAPAVRVDVFSQQLGSTIAKNRLRVFLAHLTDAAEREDKASRLYSHSLLYLVSRAFEGEVDTPILGMEKHLVPSVVSNEWGASIRRLASPGAAYRSGDKLTTATTHGGVDDDPAVQDAVIRHIKGPGFDGPVLRSA